MKKIYLCLAAALLTLSACKKDRTEEEAAPEIAQETQNAYDDQAAAQFLNDNYFDARGNIVSFSDADTKDDNYPKLSSYNPVKLPSGVIYIVRPGAQPTPGTAIGATDKLTLMVNSTFATATKTNDKVAYSNPLPFRNTISYSGVPDVDPSYYYVKQSILDGATTADSKQRSFYEIEGFKEGLMKFMAFNKSAEENYNLQGVIIVPSRAAFGRDPYFNYTGYSLRDKSFVFSFQVYKAEPRQ